jgi:CRISPR-associated protein Cmr4
LAGVFSWVTSFDVLSRLVRDACTAGITLDWVLPETQPAEEEAWVNGDSLGDPIVLEEFCFTKIDGQSELVGKIGTWLAENALPANDEYNYWKEMLPKKLCILSQDAFRDFVLYGTEVQTHIKLDPVKKTVSNGMLFTTESLPADTLMYSMIMANSSRNDGNTQTGNDLLEKLNEFIQNDCSRTNFGGDETTGQGFVALTCAGGGQ